MKCNSKYKLSEENGLLMILNALTVLLLYGADWIPEYATDTYATFVDSIWKVMLRHNGRLINVGIYYLLEDFFHTHQTATYLISYFMGVACLTAALYIVSLRLKKYCDNNVVAAAAAAAMVANLFSIEYFLFIETGLFMLAILLTVIAFDLTVCYFESGRVTRLAAAVFCLMLVVFIYQIFPGLYVILCLPFILRYTKDTRSFIKNNLVVAGAYGVSMGTGLFVTKVILGSKRLSSTYDFRGILTTLYLRVKAFLITSGYVGPRFYLFGLICILVLINLFFAIRKKSIAQFFGIAYLLLGTFVTAFFPYLSGTSGDYTLRVMYPVASIVGVLMVNLILNLECKEMIINRAGVLLPLLLIVFFVQVFSFNKIYVERYKCNAEDRFMGSLIVSRIEAYERETGQHIRRIRVYSDAETDYGYPELYYSKLIASAMDTSWSDVNSITVNFGRKYSRGNPEPEYSALFKSRNWTSFSDEQLIFDGDTLHWCIY